jgi:hypothetical protein
MTEHIGHVPVSLDERAGTSSYLQRYERRTCARHIEDDRAVLELRAFAR